MGGSARAPYAVARRQARACAVHFFCASFHVPSPAPLFTSPFFTASAPPLFAPPVPRAVLCPSPRPSLARAPSARAVVPLLSPPQSRHTTLRGLVLSRWS